MKRQITKHPLNKTRLKIKKIDSQSQVVLNTHRHIFSKVVADPDSALKTLLLGQVPCSSYSFHYLPKRNATKTPTNFKIHPNQPGRSMCFVASFWKESYSLIFMPSSTSMIVGKRRKKSMSSYACIIIQLRKC